MLMGYCEFDCVSNKMISPISRSNTKFSYGAVYLLRFINPFIGVIFGKARYDTIFCETYLWNLFGCYIEL